MYEQVLENCAKVMECFIGDNNSIKSRCLTARDTLVDQLVERYRQAIAAFDDGVGCLFVLHLLFT